MNLSTFNLKKDNAVVIAEIVIEVLNSAAKKIGVPATGVFFDGKHLIPSVMGMGQTHKKCEFTNYVKAQGFDIAKPSKTRQNAAKAKKRDLSAISGDQIEYAALYLREYGTLRIEGVGGRKTNYGNGYTLTINSGDAIEAREQAETFAVIENNAKNDSEGVYKLTCMAEVAAVMEGIGLGKAFYGIADTVKKGEVVTRKLSEF